MNESTWTPAQKQLAKSSERNGALYDAGLITADEWDQKQIAALATFDRARVSA